MIEVRNINAVLLDIEGTTSSLSFVKDVLFPYARERIPDYVRKNETKISDLLSEVRILEKKDHLGTEEIINIFLRWMDEDKKITSLKTLQGLIWKAGYGAGELKGHVYNDAAAALREWHRNGLRLYIYSSGSVTAQKLLFSHTPQGDMTPLFSGYFDTTTGPKVEMSSYRKIAIDIAQMPDKILFLSDIETETTAAAQAGFQTILVDREGKNKNAARSFDDIAIREKAA